MTNAPWGTGVRIARQHLAAGASSHLEDRLRLIYGDDLLTADERRELGFERAVRRLEQFVAEHGRLPRYNETADGFNVGRWVKNCRAARAAGALSAERVARLERVPGWSWGIPKANAFEVHRRSLIEFVAEHGRLPRYNETADGFNVGRWVKNCRAAHAAGALSAERVARLEVVPGWSWDAHADRFEEGYARLAGFVAEHGRQPKFTEVVDGFPLGRWVVSRRIEHRAGKLSPDRVARLESIPRWSWDALESAFEEGYARLAGFVAEHGRQPKDREVADGFPLGRWAANRRGEHRVGKLSADQVARLEQVPGWMWGAAHADRFENGYARLAGFVAEHGRQPKTTEVVDGFPLGQWVVSRRSEHRRGTLSLDRVARLEAVTGWSWGAPRRRTVG